MKTMNNQAKHGTWVIILSLIIGMILDIFPLPESWQSFRPSFTFLVLGYWVIALPHRIGLLWAFITGLALDALLGTTLGLHSFALAFVTFILQLNHQRLRLFPLWKQALTLILLSIIYFAIILWLARLTGKPESDSWYWMATITNGLLWPWLFILLRDIRRYFHVV
ncbi:rod shape-determining protein MreD [Kangiella sp. M94]